MEAFSSGQILFDALDTDEIPAEEERPQTDFFSKTLTNSGNFRFRKIDNFAIVLCLNLVYGIILPVVSIS